jgi:hypothetical protein
MPLGIVAFTRAVTKRASRGLYAGKKVLAGNNVSEDGGNRWARGGRAPARFLVGRRSPSPLLGPQDPPRVEAQCPAHQTV